MNWIFPALLAPAVYTCVNFLDKYIIEKEVKDYRGMPIYATIMGFVMGTIFFVATGFPIIPIRDMLILLLSGALTIWAAALYFKAISFDEASKIILLFEMTPVLVLILSYFLLGERISTIQFFAFILILIAILGVSDNLNKKGFQLTQTFWLIMAVDILWAVSAILIKFSIDQSSFAEVLSYESWGLGLGGLVLYIFFPEIRNSFLKTFTTLRKSALALMFTNEGIFVLGKGITFYAYSLGPASLVSIIGGTAIFFGILYGYVLTRFFPSIVVEDISKKTLTRKLFFGGIMFFGLYLISFY